MKNIIVFAPPSQARFPVKYICCIAFGDYLVLKSTAIVILLRSSIFVNGIIFLMLQPESKVLYQLLQSWYLVFHSTSYYKLICNLQTKFQCSPKSI